MEINLLSKNIEITDSIREYVEKRVTNFSKILSKIEDRGGEVFVHFEVGKSTNHHKSGEYFHADCKVRVDGKEYYASSDEEDLYVAIDTIKDVLFQEISREKDRKQTLFHRGARSIKKMMKGISRRNPETGKY